jgi:hypothetical protein
MGADVARYLSGEDHKQRLKIEAAEKVEDAKTSD